jgi:chromosome partitioning protein
VIPFRPEEKDIQGITAMLQVVRQENYSRPNTLTRLELVGLLPNMVRNTNLHQSNLKDFLQNHERITFPENAWLGHLTAFPERDTKGSRPKSVFQLPENSPARTQAENMAKYVENSVWRSK